MLEWLRLRPVTGYKDTYDWSKGIAAPKEDGIAIIDIDSGEKKMLLSFKQMAEGLDKKVLMLKVEILFINHTHFGVGMENGFIFL